MALAKLLKLTEYVFSGLFGPKSVQLTKSFGTVLVLKKICSISPAKLFFNFLKEIFVIRKPQLTIIIIKIFLVCT